MPGAYVSNNLHSIASNITPRYTPVHSHIIAHILLDSEAILCKW